MTEERMKMMMTKATNPRTMTTIKRTRKIENTRMVMTEERMKMMMTIKDTKRNKRKGITMTTTTTVTNHLMKKKKERRTKDKNTREGMTTTTMMTITGVDMNCQF